jgi:DNA-binding XRE family transcriptional regulator
VGGGRPRRRCRRGHRGELCGSPRHGRDAERLATTAGSRSKTPFPFKALARFADNLYRARELSGLDQKEAAKRAAVAPSRLDKIENGEYIPTLDVLIRLAGTYSTSVGDLVNGVTWRPGWIEHSGPAEYLVSEDEIASP